MLVHWAGSTAFTLSSDVLRESQRVKSLLVMQRNLLLSALTGGHEKVQKGHRWISDCSVVSDHRHGGNAVPPKIIDGEHGERKQIQRLLGSYGCEEACHGITNIAITGL
jgi:hypothetical protein